MKKIILIIAIIVNAVANFAQTDGKLAYQKITQSYKGDTVYVKLNTDTTNYWTDKKAFDFNKDIYVKGVKLGGGGGSDVAKYLKNYNPADTVISINVKGGFFGAFISNNESGTGVKINNTGDGYGYNILNTSASGTGSYILNSNYGIGSNVVNSGGGVGSSIYNSGYGSGVLVDNTSLGTGLLIKNKIGIPFKIDSLNTEKFTINSSGVPKINRYAGTGNRQIVVNSSGELVLGVPNSLIATQLKNYNNNQDTVIRFPNLASGKFGIWQNINSGQMIFCNQNDGNVNYINTNNQIQNHININNRYQNYININDSYQNLISTNNSNQNNIITNLGNQNFIDTNSSVQNKIQNNSGKQNEIGVNTGNQTFINTNKAIGYFIIRNEGTGVLIQGSYGTALGVKSLAVDTVSLTSPARTGIFGKSGYYTDIDGFGQLRLYRNNVLKLKIDTAGHILNSPPHAYSIDTTSNFNITLTQNIWKQVTNATKNFWSNNAELTYFSFIGDTVVIGKRGHYAGDFNINIAGASGATYEYRIIQKDGTTKIVNKFTVKGTGEIVYRTVPFYVQGVAGTKIWVEVRFIGAPTGSPITVTGGLFRAFPIHLY